MAKSHLFKKRCWKSHDVCLLICIFISLTLEAWLLLQCAPSVRWGNTSRGVNWWKLRLSRRGHLHLCSVTPHKHHVRDLLDLKNKVQNPICILWTPWKTNSSYKYYRFRNLYQTQMIYITRLDSQTCRVARCMKISNRSLRWLNRSSSMACLMSRRTMNTSVADSAVTGVFWRSPAHIFTEWKECILPTDTKCINSSPMRRVIHSYKTSVEIASFLDSIVNHSLLLLDLIALGTGNNKITATRWPPKIHSRIFDLQVKLKAKLSLETLEIHLLLGREKARGSRLAT